MGNTLPNTPTLQHSVGYFVGSDFFHFTILNSQFTIFSVAMLASVLTTFLWAASAVCGARSARLVGGTEANFWRLFCATVTLGFWAHLFGQGLGGVSFPYFLWSGIIGVGADVFLFQSYPLLGARLTILIIQCGAALVGAVVEWLWQGTQLTGWQIAAGATILTGVALALAPGKHLDATPRALRAGIVLSTLGAFGNAFGAVLSRRAYAMAERAGQNIDAPTAAYQRLIGGLLVAGICLLAVAWRRRQAQDFPGPAAGMPRAERWRLAWPWVLANALAGQTLGVSCYQWALSTTPTGLVLAIVSTAPLVIIPFSRIMEGEKMTRRSICGGVLAVLGAIVLVTVTGKTGR
jgi:drug/metabolite transporter (DMT)-like permease